MTFASAYIHDSLQDIYPAQEITAFSRLILEHICHLSLSQLLVDKDRQLSERERKEIKDIVERLKRQEPIQYILGQTEFYGLTFKVSPSVLIPRPETEELVNRILADNKHETGLRVLDIGTGSGCIAIALARGLKEAEVTAVDISADALATAVKNARRLHAGVNFLEMDILTSRLAHPEIPFGLDIIVSNPPYIQKSEREGMDRNVADYEPETALFVPDEEPLLFYHHIAHFGKRKLRRGGRVYVETHALFGPQTFDLFRRNRYKKVELIRDISGKNRFLKAEL